MKTMTCKQMGGPCDKAFQAETADEVIQMQDKHLKNMAGGGDTKHEQAAKDMAGRWRNPIGGMKWYLKTKKDFAALKED